MKNWRRGGVVIITEVLLFTKTIDEKHNADAGSDNCTDDNRNNEYDKLKREVKSRSWSMWGTS